MRASRRKTPQDLRFFQIVSLFRSFQDWTQNLVDNDGRSLAASHSKAGLLRGCWLPWKHIPAIAVLALSYQAGSSPSSLSGLVMRNDAVRAIPVLALAGVGGQLLSM